MSAADRILRAASAHFDALLDEAVGCGSVIRTEAAGDELYAAISAAGDDEVAEAVRSSGDMTGEHLAGYLMEVGR